MMAFYNKVAYPTEHLVPLSFYSHHLVNEQGQASDELEMSFSDPQDPQLTT